MRLIDADVLLEYLQIIPIDLGYREVEEIEEYVKGMPTIEERKKGKWEITNLGAIGVFDSCSECKRVVKHKAPFYNFCPNCGADMMGEGEKE